MIAAVHLADELGTLAICGFVLAAMIAYAVLRPSDVRRPTRAAVREARLDLMERGYDDAQFDHAVTRAHDRALHVAARKAAR